MRLPPLLARLSQIAGSRGTRTAISPLRPTESGESGIVFFFAMLVFFFVEGLSRDWAPFGAGLSYPLVFFSVMLVLGGTLSIPKHKA